VARYRHWNCDHVIEWVMAGGKGDESGGSGTTVIQRKVHEVGNRTVYPLLTKINYSEWSMLMKVKLKARGLWVTVDKGGIDPQEDMMALDALVSALPPEMVVTVADKSSAKDAWQAIATMHVGDERTKKATMQHLRWQYEMATFTKGKSVEDFAMRLNGMVATLAMLSEVIEEKRVVEKIICSVPSCLRQVVITITTILHVQTLSVPDLAGRLRIVKEAFKEPLRRCSWKENSTSLRKSGTCTTCDMRQRTQVPMVRAVPVDRAAMVALAVMAAAAAEMTMGVVVDMVAGTGVAVVGYRGRMSAAVVGSWATGPVNVGPRPRRIRPTVSKMRRQR
jgi:hypothetical protein